jgi:hypothetical protein
MKVIVIIAFAVACLVFMKLNEDKSPESKTEEVSTAIPIDLKSKLDIYLELIKSVQDNEGFIEFDGCNSTMYSGLLAIDGLAEAENDGEWSRRSLSYPDCFETGLTDTSITRDQILGVIYNLVKTKNRKGLERLWQYGYNNNWILGEGDISKTIATSRLISTIAQAIFFLGGEDNKQRFINEGWPDVDGYEGYLQVLHIYIRGEIYGHINKDELAVLERHVDLHPDNPFYQTMYHRYTDADYDKAISLLMNKYPANRLPTSTDYCSDWPIERDYNPCPDQNKIHSGGDFIFVARIILGEM